MTVRLCRALDGQASSKKIPSAVTAMISIRPKPTLKAEGPNDCYRNAEWTLGDRLTSHNPAQSQGDIGRLLVNR